MKRISIVLVLLSILLFGFFLYWSVTVLLPVAFVEMTYQLKKTAFEMTGSSDLRKLLVPSFSLNFDDKPKHPEGSIVIPSLFLDAPIIFNIDPNNPDIYLAALKNGIAHAAGTKLPSYGGLGYYFAHSSNPSFVRQYNAVFYLIGKLKGGEKITVWYEGKSYGYTVTNTKITNPDDLSFLDENQYSTETIVLQTCWPPGISAQRLLVFAQRD